MEAPCFPLFADFWEGCACPYEYQVMTGEQVCYEHPVGAGAMRCFYSGASKQSVAAMEQVRCAFSFLFANLGL